MPVSDRMLIGAIAGNPAAYEGAGEYRYSLTHDQIYYSSAKKPHDLDQAQWVALPALNADGSTKLTVAFKRFITRWSPERQAELEKFAERRGWDMAMELKYGGGALEDHEASEWQEIVNGRLDMLMKQARTAIERASKEEEAVKSQK